MMADPVALENLMVEKAHLSVETLASHSVFPRHLDPAPSCDVVIDRTAFSQLSLSVPVRAFVCKARMYVLEHAHVCMHVYVILPGGKINMARYQLS